MGYTLTSASGLSPGQTGRYSGTCAGAGFITTEAMLWCHELRVPLVVARTGQVPTMVSAPVLYDHGGIRRAQAVAAYVKGKDTRSLAVTIGRYLLDTKLANQARTLTTELGRPM